MREGPPQSRARTRIGNQLEGATVTDRLTNNHTFREEANCMLLSATKGHTELLETPMEDKSVELVLEERANPWPPSPPPRPPPPPSPPLPHVHHRKETPTSNDQVLETLRVSGGTP